MDDSVVSQVFLDPALCIDYRMRIDLVGEIDLAVGERLRGLLEATLDEEPIAIFVDASQVTFVDVGSLEVLLDAKRQCAARAVDFGLVPSLTVQTVLDLTGLARALGARRRHIVLEDEPVRGAPVRGDVSPETAGHAA